MKRQIHDSEGWRRNIGLIFGMRFFQVFLVIMPVAVPFFQSKGLSMQDVFVLQAIFAVLVLLLEVPSGYVADICGRRLAVVLGTVACGVGHSMLVVAEGFCGLVLFEAFLALARSLVSGADLALAYESAVMARQNEMDRGAIVGRLYAWATTAESVAALVCSAIIAAGTLQDVAWVQASVGWVPLGLALWLVEPPRTRMVAGEHLENLREVIWHIAGCGALIWLTIAVWCVWGLTTYFAVWLLQKIWMDQSLALEYFGYFWSAYMLLAAAAGRMARHLENWFGAPVLLVFCGVAPALGYLGLQCPETEVAAMSGGLFFLARGIGAVLLQEAFNSRMRSEFRATANSMLSFSAGLASALVGPLVGWFVDVWPLQVALGVLAAFSLLVLAVLVIPLVLRVRSSARRVAA